MEIVVAPNLAPSNSVLSGLWIFLAGGITGCHDWQTYAIDKVKHIEGPLLFNPRREDFDTSKPEMSKEQIGWEYKYLAASNIIFFWFPPETLCPITLFELGKAAAQHKSIVVGCHPDYQRKFDVIEQLALCRRDVKVYDSLDETIEALIRKIK